MSTHNLGFIDRKARDIEHARYLLYLLYVLLISHIIGGRPLEVSCREGNEY